MTVTESPTRPPGPQPILDGTRGLAQQIGVYVFVVVPLLALIAAVPLAWGWGLSWVDVALAAVFYVISGLGITVGFHRYFTHSSFKAANSICHMIGDAPFAARDHSRNVWPLAVLSFGESWHNLHHADPTCARHGVQRGQVDISARVIWAFEKLRWATSVRWPTARRLERLAVPRLRQIQDVIARSRAARAA